MKERNELLQGKEKKSGNTKKTAFKMLVWMTGGAVLGFGLARLTLSHGGIVQTAVKSFFADLNMHLIYYGVWYGGAALALFTALYLIGLFGAKRAGREQSEHAQESRERFMNLELLAAELNMVLQFVLFGVSIDPANPRPAAMLFVFAAAMAGSVLAETLTIMEYRRYDPAKKGDPSSLHFEKDWENGLDEAEKLLTYKVGYRTCMAVKKLMPVMMLICLIGKFMLDWSVLPAVLFGAQWLFFILAYFYYDRQLSCKSLN